MKTLMLSLGILLLSLGSASTAYAGTLNDNEIAIVDAAREIYEYEGKKYRVDPIYINKLIDYLSQDNVDLTMEGKELVLNSVYDYIETGVKEGYLILVEEQNDQGEQKNTNPENGKPQDDAIDNSVIQGKEEKQQDQFTQGNKKEDRDRDNGTTGVPTKDAIIASTDKGATLPDLVQTLPESEENHTEHTAVSVEPIDNIDSIDNNTSNPWVEPDDIIKNTGFNLNQTFIVMMGMGILMLAGIIVTINNNYFAQADE